MSTNNIEMLKKRGHGTVRRAELFKHAKAQGYSEGYRTSKIEKIEDFLRINTFGNMQLEQNDFDFTNNPKIKVTISKPHITSSGRIYVKHTFKFKLNLDKFANLYLENKEKELKEYIQSFFYFPKGFKYFQISYYGLDEREQGISLPYMEKNKSFEKLYSSLCEHYQEYESFNVIKLVLNCSNELPMNAQGGSRSIDTANKTWVIISPQSRTNCAFSACQICIDKEYTNRTAMKAKDLKIRINPENKLYTGKNEWQLIADHIKRDIIIYNNIFAKIETYKTSAIISRSTLYRNKERCNPIEIQISNGHAHALIRRTKENPYVEPEKKIEHDCKRQHCEIIKKFKKANEFNFKVIAWDLEASVDEKNNFQIYAAGMYDGQTYYDFWNDDDGNAIEKFTKHIYDNRQMYSNYLFYAHNGGKYDVFLFMQQSLLNSTLFEICSEKNIELNSRWLNFVLSPVGEPNILFQFRDSLPLFGGGSEKSSLAELTKEYKVDHQKLTELVSHDDITLNNFHEYQDVLKTYLYNDVMGLYELLEMFAHDVWNMSNKRIVTREEICRTIFENLTGKQFKSCKPQFLKIDTRRRLELDGYNEELKIAFEHQGEQHYKPVKYLNKTSTLESIQACDKIKRERCEQNGIHLIEIKHDIPKYKLFPYIIEELNKLKIKLLDWKYDESTAEATESGINLESLFTGATLAKKYFFHKYYNHFNFPIFTLSDKMDKFIRKDYYGGRCEIFVKPSVEIKGKIYYYDFTSLYPSQMVGDLPYGEPIWKEFEDGKLPKDFYGFVRCKVKSLKTNLKPLHACYNNGKLIFPFFENQTELVLFSEEIKVGIKYKLYEYEFLEGIHFQKGPIMKNAVEDVFKNKSEASIKGETSKAQMWKIILNSMYGFWGLRTKGRDTVKIHPRGEEPPYIEQGKLINQSDVGNYTICRIVDDLQITDFNVSIASAITSLSRIKLWNLIKDIESKGKHVYMCDTDSVITDLDLHEHEDLKDLYQWDGKGEELGSLKNELNDKLKKKKLEHNVNKNYHFDQVIFGGLKFYSIKCNSFSVDISKCKGYKQKDEDKLNYKVFSDVINTGKNLSQTQRQFRSGKQSMLSESCPFYVNKSFISKSCPMKYNKATEVEDSIWLEPLKM